MLAECSCVLELCGEDTFIEALDQRTLLCHNELLEQILFLAAPDLTTKLLLAVKERATNVSTSTIFRL